MSIWTQVIGVIEVDLYNTRTTEQTRSILSHIVKNAPKVTGSERVMEVHMSLCDYYSYNYSNDGETEHKLKTHALISFIGHLRDRTVEAVDIELKEFVQYIDNHVDAIYGLSIYLDDGGSAIQYNTIDDLV